MMQKKILIIDDDRNIAKSLEEILAKEGYLVFSSDNWAEGLIKLQEVNPDLLLLDLVLPDHSGFKIAQEIKAIPEFVQLPIVAISLKREEVDKHIAAKSGIVEYLEKPINYDRLRYVIKDILG